MVLLAVGSVALRGTFLPTMHGEDRWYMLSTIYADKPVTIEFAVTYAYLIASFSQFHLSNGIL